ncbi:restriction endonuclease subunit S [Vibrio splendidus]|uniref:restriction endonuclease subunit S n=1 Tax=Vibrio splendidus TaxID=29497 RepID=UPI000C84AC01|nr:restriction endonuclease subunit S [Vibrio splendidus]PMJ71516.1 hypothetical protein BCU23_16880 [Vibrio splendidus]
MSKVKTQYPILRLKEFGEVWTPKSLGNICAIGDIDHWMPSTVSEGIPYLMTGDFIGINELDFANAKLISEMDYCRLARKIKPEYGDILFARYASVGAVRYVNTDKQFQISYSCAILKSHKSYDSQFLFYNIQSPDFQNKIELEINTGSQRNIGIDSLKGLDTSLPSRKEQAKIGNFFENIDQQLKLHQAKLTKLHQLKKAMLGKMFPKKGSVVPEVRFAGFSEDWITGQVKNVCSISTGKSNTQDKVKGGKYPFYVRSPNIERSNRYLYNEEAVLTVGDGVGTGKVYHYVNGKYDLHQRVYRMYNFTNVIGSFFYLFFSENFDKRVIAMTAKTSVDSVRLEMIADMEILYPISTDEQSKVGDYFQNLERLIKLQQQQISKLENIKQSFLEKMFV